MFRGGGYVACNHEWLNLRALVYKNTQDNVDCIEWLQLVLGRGPDTSLFSARRIVYSGHFRYYCGRQSITQLAVYKAVCFSRGSP
eukprot:1218252-Pleurochrysis_carterae.AAC.1